MIREAFRALRCTILGHRWISLPGLQFGSAWAQSMMGLRPPIKAHDLVEMAAEPGAMRYCTRCKAMETRTPTWEEVARYEDARRARARQHRIAELKK